MPDINTQHCDILIAGAGFGGSITAMALHNQGFKVCVLERGQHPRFTIGESSTPIADMLLRDIARKYNLPWLHDFSRYGSWQKSHPGVICGLKRGFSFFKHYPDKEFYTDADHSTELLVAASANDTESDTNWLRADFDAFLVNKMKESAITYYDNTEIVSVEKKEGWIVKGRYRENDINIHTQFFIDATGSGNLMNNLFGIKSSANEFLTNSFAVFSHFKGAIRWTDLLQHAGISTKDFPYNADDSALHQVLNEGWIWMLRFNDGRLSFGFALNGQEQQLQEMQTNQLWDYLLKRYPSVNNIIKEATLAHVPGSIIRTGRLQRKLEKCFGEGWVALPHTVGFVDPLFSPGIAYSLAGMERIIDIISNNWKNPESLYKKLGEYEHAVLQELQLTDQLIAGCYKTMPHFELFNAWSMLYFASTITYEQKRLRNEPPGYLLGADNEQIRNNVNISYNEMLKLVDKKNPSKKDVAIFIDNIKRRIEPFNNVGLMNPSARNMYYHTVARL